MYEMGLENTEEPEIKLQTFAGSLGKPGNTRKKSTSASLTTLKPLTMEITRNWKFFLKGMGIPDSIPAS